MVASLLVDAINDPHASLAELYASFDGDGDAFPAHVTQHYSSIFQSKSALQEIPLLNLQNPPEAYLNKGSKPSLIRFRGMVQDTSPSPELYLSKTSQGGCGGWGIVDDAQNDNFDYADLRECIVLWVVSVPGEAEWHAQQLDGDYTHKHGSVHTALQPHKFPLPDTSHVGLYIKVYDSSQGPFRSTDVFNFVGLLSPGRIHADSEFDAPSQAPTLHVLFSVSAVSEKIYPQPNVTGQTREKLILWIANEALGGDTLAAEWTLLVVISRVQSRTPAILPLSLTLAHASATTQTSLPALSHILELLLPTFVSIPLTLDVLNKRSFMPQSKDEDLYGGWLQLPGATTVLVSESGISEGTVNENGLLNIRCLQSLMKEQTLDYVFPFSRFSFSTDLSCIVFTEGKKSAFFQTDVILLIQSSTPSHELYKPSNKINMPDEGDLGDFRNLIESAKAQAGRVNISESTSKRVQEDFVKERQESQITSDDLIRRMTMAKLITLSSNLEEVTVEVWEKAKHLDVQRAARLSV